MHCQSTYTQCIMQKYSYALYDSLIVATCSHPYAVFTASLNVHRVAFHAVNITQSIVSAYSSSSQEWIVAPVLTVTADSESHDPSSIATST